MKILYISCLNTKKEQYDGERIKCTLVYNSLKKFADVKVINLSEHKIFNTIRIFFEGLFNKKKYDYIVISKDAHGANIIQKILRLAKYPSNKIVYFQVGPNLYIRINNGTIKKELFIDDKLIIIETETMKKELESLGFERISIIPNFKPIIHIDYSEQNYPKDILKLVFLSRIEEPKGIYDLIDVLSKINKEKTKYVLDVYGRPQNKEEEEKINALSIQYDFVNFLGTIPVDNKETYEQLSQYDLHVFPTKYPEGIPGTLIDFFIAGVPTLSSEFARVHEILTEKDSIIYKQGDNKELQEKLEYIYDNQSILNELRKNSYNRKEDYSVERFEESLQELIRRDFNVK